MPGILIGSDRPIEVDRGKVLAGLSDPRAREHYARAGIDATRMIDEYLAEPAIYLPTFDRSTLSEVNTDLFPKDEFDLRRPGS